MMSKCQHFQRVRQLAVPVRWPRYVCVLARINGCLLAYGSDKFNLFTLSCL